MAWSFSPDRAVYLQVADKIRARVVSGEYVTGEQIPTVRQLAIEAAVNPNTMQRALTELEAEGLLESSGTLGRFVTTDAEVIIACKDKMIRELVSDFVRNVERLGVTQQNIIKVIMEVTNERT